MIKVPLTNDQYDFLLELFKRLLCEDRVNDTIVELVHIKPGSKDAKLVRSIYSTLDEQRFNRHGFSKDWPPSQDLPVEIPDAL